MPDRRAICTNVFTSDLHSNKNVKLRAAGSNTKAGDNRHDFQSSRR